VELRRLRLELSAAAGCPASGGVLGPRTWPGSRASYLLS